ncbi:MAG: DUF4150 domain-containing protein [Proteobacteria bacterium]|nr:DUF4150 domain-containing protein [Pseudomonadota bacterium]
MSNSVYANAMGLFHKGSGGQGIAPGDVCLSPPPPPAGPVPVPYVNMLSASDLTKGSKSVKVQGNPTALEDTSEIASSTGDEAGTQGGNVVTHKTKGKGTFQLWSFDVKFEGKGVCRNGDTLGQAGASTPSGIIDPSAIVDIAVIVGDDFGKPCPEEKKNAPQTATNEKQRESVRGGPCWSCGAKINKGTYKSGGKFDKGDRFVADHQPPQSAVWAMGGCHNEEKFNAWKKSNAAVKPHCTTCSNNQGQVMRDNQGKSVLEYLAMAWPG